MQEVVVVVQVVVALVDKAVLNGTDAHQVYSSYAYQVSPPSYEIWNIEKIKQEKVDNWSPKSTVPVFSLTILN